MSAAVLPHDVTIVARPIASSFAARGTIDVKCPAASDKVFTATPDEHEQCASSALRAVGFGEVRNGELDECVVWPDVPENNFEFTIPAGTPRADASVHFRLRTTSSICNRYCVHLDTVLSEVANNWDGRYCEWLASCDGAIRIQVCITVADARSRLGEST